MAKLVDPASKYVIEDKIHVVCPRGHVDHLKKPGFGLTVEQGGEAQFFQLCRVCYHEFFVQTFPGKPLPLATFEEAQAEAAAWKAETDAELVKQLSDVERKVPSGG